MVHRYFIALLCLLASCFSLSSVASPGVGTKILHVGELLAVPGKAPVSEQSIVVVDDRIRQISNGYIDAASLNLPASQVEVIDLKDRFVLPGLIDLHVHLGEDKPEYVSDANVAVRVNYMTDGLLALRAYPSALKTLRNGFTTLRDAGSHGTSIRDLRDAINAGYVEGPRLLVSMNFIEIPGGVDDLSYGLREELVDLRQGSGHCSGVESCQSAVREQARRGADFIKVDNQSVSGRSRSDRSNFTDEEMNAIVDAAKRLGLQVSTHAMGGTIRQALEAGSDSIEHGWHLYPKDYKLFKKSGAFMVPTLTSAHSGVIHAREAGASPQELAWYQARWDSRRDAQAAALKAGIPFAFGSDTWDLGHGDNIREFLLLEQIGMTPMQAIVSATINASRVLDMEDEIGTIEVGKSADILALKASPLEDMKKMLDIAFVMAQGKVARQD